MLQECFRSTLGIRQEYSRSTLGVLWEYCRSSLGVLQKYFRSSLGVVQEYFRNTLGIRQGYFRNTLGILQESLRNTLGILQDGGHRFLGTVFLKQSYFGILVLLAETEKQEYVGGGRRSGGCRKCIRPTPLTLHSSKSDRGNRKWSRNICRRQFIVWGGACERSGKICLI